MPCITDPSWEIGQYEKQINKLTDMLCRMIAEYERFYTINSMGKDIEEWWNKHKEWDKNRKEKS